MKSELFDSLSNFALLTNFVSYFGFFEIHINNIYFEYSIFVAEKMKSNYYNSFICSNINHNPFIT